MNSIFLLSENPENHIDEVHFNLWIVGPNSFLDVGLKLNNDQKVELYLPWQNAKPEDLFGKIKEDNVLNAIFNQHLSIFKNTNHQYVTIDLGGEKIDITRSNFEIDNDIKSQDSIFTKIIVSPQGKTENKPYLRFRFNGIKKDVFSKCHTGRDAFINPYRESQEVIDFRINEVRSVPWHDLKSKSSKTPAIGKMHFFLLKSYKENITLASPNFLRCRELEDKAWDQYLPSRQANDATLAYHWKEELKEDSHYSILATFSRKQTSWGTVFGYILVILFLNYLSNCSYEKFKPNWALPKVQSENSSIQSENSSSNLKK